MLTNEFEPRISGAESKQINHQCPSVKKSFHYRLVSGNGNSTSLSNRQMDGTILETFSSTFFVHLMFVGLQFVVSICRKSMFVVRRFKRVFQLNATPVRSGTLLLK